MPHSRPCPQRPKPGPRRKISPRSLGQVLCLPDAKGGIARVLVGYGTAARRARDRFHMGAAARKLPEGTYEIASGLSGDDLEEAALAWLLAGYSYDRYIKPSKPVARLVAPEEVDAGRIAIIANGEALTPRSDQHARLGHGACMSWKRLHAPWRRASSASINVIKGDDLITSNFPMIHTVGRASTRAPRLIDMRWGDSRPAADPCGQGGVF